MRSWASSGGPKLLEFGVRWARSSSGCGPKQEGLRRCWSMFPLPRVSFWYRFFEPQPSDLAGGHHLAVLVKTVLGSHFGGFSVHHQY